MSTGLSIHIGLNHVDPAAYNGWDGKLFGCINDARDMQSIANGIGYQSMLLTDGQATSSSVISAIGQAAQSLESGDTLFLTYSGHGGQVDDVNGEEADAQDETWVLYDRQLIDDELYCLWSQFAPGVRIVMLSDSCHSGTVLRMLKLSDDLKREIRSSKGAPPSAKVSLLDSLATNLRVPADSGDSGDSGEGSHGGTTRDAKGRYSRSTESSDAPMASSGGGTGTAVMDRPTTATTQAAQGSAAAEETQSVAKAKTIPPDVRELVNDTHAAENASLQWLAGPSEKAQVAASVILISGCQDDQLSMDGSGNGLFTEKLKATWNNGSFNGDYQAFWAGIVARMPASQKPNYATTGAPNPTFEAERPFTIDGGGGGAVTPSGRPTLRRGSQGPDVSYLQQKLVDAGYSVTIDGNFGFHTEAAVVEFQETNGLTADGIVGPQTWGVLESGGAGPSNGGAGPSGGGSGPSGGGTGPSGGGSQTPTTTRPTLRQGSSGPDVRYLQGRLVEYGYNLTIDGQFGPMTASAVRAFQSSNGLTPDGIVGPLTWAALG
jgi:peptidoglycan hydrolase-like protein with peptidoglycan-binding domain